MIPSPGPPAPPAPPAAPAPPAEIPTVDIPPDILARVASHLPTQDMHTVAAFVPPMKRERGPWWRIPMGVLVALGVVAGLGVGAQHLLKGPPAQGDAVPAAPSAVASATPLTPTPNANATGSGGRPARPTPGRAVAKPAAANMIAVQLESKPSGAKVFQADVLIGKTPTSLVLPRKLGAKRRYVLKRAGYKTVKKWIRMDKDSTVKVRLKKKK